MHPESFDSVGKLAEDLKRHAKLMRSVGITEIPGLDSPLPVEELIQRGDIVRKPTPAVQSPQKPEPKVEVAPPVEAQPEPVSEPIPEQAPMPEAEVIPEIKGEQSAQLLALQEHIGDCTRCSLHEQGRTHVVFGVGNPQADIMFIGEAPGAHEDAQGIPFVGRAGELLTRIIEGGMKMSRDDVYIANIIKCRPPRNRDPLPEEVATCRPFILKQIDIIQPKVIVTLGRVAMQALLGNTDSITRTRGQWREIKGYPVMPTFHPAYLLRNPDGKKDVWQDIKSVLTRLNDTK